MPKLHEARLEPWTPDELKARLAAIVDGLDEAAPLKVALELLSGELEAFVLFGRLGHLDPPREDGGVSIAVLQRRSADPTVDERIRESAFDWASESNVGPTEVQRMVREQIAGRIESDLKGGERLMKECFEDLPGDTPEAYERSLKECDAEMEAIIKWLRRAEA